MFPHEKENADFGKRKALARNEMYATIGRYTCVATVSCGTYKGEAYSFSIDSWLFLQDLDSHIQRHLLFIPISFCHLTKMFEFCALACALRAAEEQSISRPCAAKVSSITVPQEYDLIRLIQNMQERPPSWNTDTPACEWEGVECDEKNQVKEFSWCFENLGFLVWKYLPQS